MTPKRAESKRCVTEPPSKFFLTFKNYLGYLRRSCKLLIGKNQQFVEQLIKGKATLDRFGKFSPPRRLALCRKWEGETLNLHHLPHEDGCSAHSLSG